MDLDDDTHLCLRCGKTVEGLDNYVSHRQQQCYKYQQPSFSPFLSDTSKSLHSSKSDVEDFQHDFPQDIYKLSASDFFLSLNLQSNYKSVDPCTNISSDLLKNTEDNICSALEMPVEDNELVDVFESEKELCPDKIVDEHNCLDSVVLDSEKWDSFKIPNDFCEDNLCFSKDGAALTSDEGRGLEHVSSSSLDKALNLQQTAADQTVATDKVRRYKKKSLKQYSFSQFSILNIPRTSYRQKLNANGSLLCCQDKQNGYKCIFCNLTFTFATTFLGHLLGCPNKSGNVKKWKEEILSNGSLFVRSLHFKCLLCSFFCGDSFVFLEHLRSRNHRQNAASLKNPLICLPCQDEGSASDEMKEHFSKSHLRYSMRDHPVIVTEKKKNLHCCYCLSLIRRSSHFDAGSCVCLTLKQDLNFLKCSFSAVSSCAYGVDKGMFNSYTTKTLADISQCDKKATLTSVDNPQKHSITSVLLEEPLKLKISKTVLRKDKSSKNHKENVDQANGEAKGNRGRLIGKITSKGGKFIYTKLKICNSNKVWLCIRCGVKRTNKASLDRHQHKCESDVKGKSRSMHLKKKYQNLKTKLTKNQYMCDRCPYTGRSFNQLTRHSRTHSGIKPFKCPDCDYTFAQSSQLIRHRRLHSGQKPYNCPYCSYACNTQENLRKHILKTKKHKGKMMYPCQHCAYESNEYSTFKDHLLEDHSEHFPNGVAHLHA